MVYDPPLKDFTPVTNTKGPINREGIRRMTPREWAALEGFVDEFIIPAVRAAGEKIPEKLPL